MTEREHLQLCVMEECSEIAHRVSKAMRFGLDEVQPGQPLTNRERVEEELDDLMGVLELAGISLHRNIERIVAKQQKVRKYLAYARKRGMVWP